MGQLSFVSLDLPANVAYLHIPGACLAALFEADENLAGHEDLIYGLQLAVYEVCTNIVRHSYRIDDCAPAAVVDCRIRIVFTPALQPSRLAIDLYDSGRSFDMSLVRQPDVADPQTQGYGLYLVRQLVDDVYYEAEAGGNHWRLTKRL